MWQVWHLANQLLDNLHTAVHTRNTVHPECKHSVERGGICRVLKVAPQVFL